MVPEKSHPHLLPFDLCKLYFLTLFNFPNPPPSLNTIVHCVQSCSPLLDLCESCVCKTINVAFAFSEFEKSLLVDAKVF